MRYLTFLLLLFIAACSRGPVAPVTAGDATPTMGGFLGLVFEEEIDGSLVGVNFVDHPYTETEYGCRMNNATYVAGGPKAPRGDVYKQFCLTLVRPAVGKLTQIAVIDHGLGQRFVAVAVEFTNGDNPVWGARVLGQADDEASCIAMGKDTISASLKDHKIKHPLTISCIAVPPVKKAPEKDGMET